MNAIIDNEIYTDLVVKVLPTVILSDEEYKIMLENIDELMSKGEENILPEELRLLKTLVILVEDYEDENYPIPKLSPHLFLQEMMKERGIRQKDLLPVFGSSGIASEVCNGKRAISKAQAKKLAEFFKVSVELFL